MQFRPPRLLRSHRPWSVPLAYAAAAIALGLRGPDLGLAVFGTTASRMSPDSAIALLAAIGTGMMALTGIVFSLVFVALQFGTTTYGPRLGDELGSQRILPHAMGIFSGTFLYSTLAIRTVDLEGSKGVSLPAVIVAFVWLVASVVVLVLLVPQLQGLTIGTVLDKLGTTAQEDIRVLYPRLDHSEPVNQSPHLRRGRSIHARCARRALLSFARLRLARVREPIPPGPDLSPSQVVRHQGNSTYLLALHEKALVDLASRHGCVLRVPQAVGDPVLPGDAIVEVLGASSKLPERKLRRAVLLRSRRTIDYNPMYVLRLLSDIAIRALSPAVNDPTTAVMALDQSQGILALLGRSDLDIGRVADEHGAQRLTFPTPTWEDAVALALTEILQYGGGSPQVQRRMGRLLADLLAALPEERRPALRRFVERRTVMIEEAFPEGMRRDEARAFDLQGLGHTKEFG